MTSNPSALARLPRVADNALLTYSGVVKKWECDRNDHWNMQFYVRAFQMASEVLASCLSGNNPGSTSTQSRHMRFYGELFCPEPMQIQSSRIIGGPQHGRLVHLMTTGADRRICATAIEEVNFDISELPPKSAEEVAMAMPRGLTSAAPEPDQALLPLGSVRPNDVDHHNDITANELMNRVAMASHQALDAIGFTSEWINKNNCNRMAVEICTQRHRPCSAGDSLAAVTQIEAKTGAKTFVMRHRLVNLTTGAACASVEMVLLVVDLTSRKSIAVPDFMAQPSAVNSLADGSHGVG